jgi:hypothetical protein
MAAEVNGNKSMLVYDLGIVIGDASPVFKLVTESTLTQILIFTHTQLL